MKLLQMAKENASQQIAEQTRRTSREISALDELARLLGLHQIPNYIEAYDISNIGSETIVAGMVVFEGGRPLKGAYRKFSVRSVVGKPDDYASMREVITRRLERYSQHKEEGVGFGHLPDLILLDGGKGHVAAGIDGIVQKLQTEARDGKTEFPETLGVVLRELDNNTFAKSSFGEKLCRMYKEGKQEEWDRFCSHVTDWEMKEYLYRC